MAGRIEDKVALVVGAGSIGPGWGNGKAAAVLYAREGARLFAVDIDGTAAEETRAIIAAEGGRCESFVADAADARQVATAVDACRARFGRIDILHNNVGIAVVGGVADTDEADWDRINAVNLKSVFLACRAVIPSMVAQGGGAIVNISSISGIRSVGVPLAAYAATKAGILGLTMSIATSYARAGVRCNAVLPGLINTPLIHASLAEHYAGGDVERMIAIRDAQVPRGRMGDAWDVAYASLFLASDEARFITGQALAVDGGQTAMCVTPPPG